jgi:GR25 family glycosyltransferase involved in LPS biosynthesis
MSLPSNWAEVCKTKACMFGLKRYAFRREYSAAKMAAIGFSNVELLDGFDGFQESADDALKKIGLEVIPNIGPGHKGCIYTHFLAWKQMIEEGAPYRIFFEDDVLGHLDLPNGLGQKFWDATPKDFDILYLGNMINPHDPVLADPNALVVRAPTYCLHAYMLTLEGAKRLWALAKELIAKGIPIITVDIQLVRWIVEEKIKSYCWNGTWIQKSYPTYDQGLPWQAFPDIIMLQKDTGLFWQNMRLGTTLGYSTIQLELEPNYG